jgi:hypothetical protein
MSPETSALGFEGGGMEGSEMDAWPLGRGGPAAPSA